MEIQELFSRLDEHHGSFPKHLIAEAIIRREEVAPALLQILADIDRDPEPWLADTARRIHIYAMYLLALFRETRAYPLLVRIFSRPGRFPFDLVGDVLTQDLARILASVCGGDASGIKSLIEDEQANEYVRAVGMQAIISLVTIGRLTRDEAMAYFMQLFHKFERRPGYQWDGLANVCCDLWPGEAMEELRRIYDEDLVGRYSIVWEDVKRDLARGKEAALDWGLHHEPLINDLARNMGWMLWFHKLERKPTFKQPMQIDRNQHVVATVRRTTPKTGRNDPCNCGSGKKFKRCCGVN